MEITEQYLDYIKQMESEDMNVMSEFLLMAATLIDIKCRMLLPKEVNEEGEKRIQEQSWYRSCWNIRCINICRWNCGTGRWMPSGIFTDSSSFPREVEAYRQPIDYEELIGDMTLNKLHEIFKSIVRKQEDKIDPIRSQYGNIEKEEIDMDSKMLYVEAFAREHKHFSFRRLLEKQSAKWKLSLLF